MDINKKTVYVLVGGIYVSEFTVFDLNISESYYVEGFIQPLILIRYDCNDRMVMFDGKQNYSIHLGNIQAMKKENENINEKYCTACKQVKSIGQFKIYRGKYTRDCAVCLDAAKEKRHTMQRPTILSLKIKEILSEESMTYEKLAIDMNVSTNSVTRWMKGWSPKNLKSVKRLSKYFKETEDTILHWGTTLMQDELNKVKEYDSVTN